MDILKAFFEHSAELLSRMVQTFSSTSDIKNCPSYHIRTVTGGTLTCRRRRCARSARWDGVQSPEALTASLANGRAGAAHVPNHRMLKRSPFPGLFLSSPHTKNMVIWSGLRRGGLLKKIK